MGSNERKMFPVLPPHSLPYACLTFMCPILSQTGGNPPHVCGRLAFSVVTLSWPQGNETGPPSGHPTSCFHQSSSLVRCEKGAGPDACQPSSPALTLFPVPLPPSPPPDVPPVPVPPQVPAPCCGVERDRGTERKKVVGDPSPTTHHDQCMLCEGSGSSIEKWEWRTCHKNMVTGTLHPPE